MRTRTMVVVTAAVVAALFAAPGPAMATHTVPPGGPFGDITTPVSNLDAPGPFEASIVLIEEALVRTTFVGLLGGGLDLLTPPARYAIRQEALAILNRILLVVGIQGPLSGESVLVTEGGPLGTVSVVNFAVPDLRVAVADPSGPGGPCFGRRLPGCSLTPLRTASAATRPAGCYQGACPATGALGTSVPSTGCAFCSSAHSYGTTSAIRLGILGGGL